MNTLFPVETNWPNGFTYTPEFITPTEEELLLGVVKGISLHNFNFHGYTANRRVASFGYDYSFDDGRLAKGKEIPASFFFLLEKVSKHLHITVNDFAELLVSEYPVGSEINWHRDAPPFDVIVGISLLSDCLLKLRPHEKAQQNRKNIVTVPVAKRSLYVMKDEARRAWQHSTAPVKATRYSITLRTLK